MNPRPAELVVARQFLESTRWMVRVPATLVGPALLPVSVAMFLRMRDGLAFGVISNLIGALALAIGIAQLLVFRRREKILLQLNSDQ